MKNKLSGMRDIVGDKYNIRKKICELFELHLEKFFYLPIELPIIESLELYKNTSGDTSDIVSKELYFVKNIHENECTEVLRPEATASVVRAVINMDLWQQKSNKLYYIGPMFRHNRPQKYRYRQFVQCGCEILNPANYFLKAENLIMLTEFLDALNIPFALHLNVIPSDMSLYTEAVKMYFESRLDLLSNANIETLQRNPLRVLDQVSQSDKFNDAPKSIDFLNANERSEFDKILHILDQNNVGYVINNKLVRGLDYYVGIVFEIIHNNLALGGGGGYRMPGSRFNIKEDIYGFGWALGLDRIEDFTNIVLDKKEIYLVISIDCDDYAFKIGMRLRNENKKVGICFNGFKKGIEVAKKLSNEYIVQMIFIGEAEKNSDSFLVKTWQD